MIITKVVDTYYAVQCVRDTFITIKKIVVNGTTQSSITKLGPQEIYS